MKCLARYSLSLAFALTPHLALAQDTGRGGVAPFVNGDTVAVVRLDLK